MINGCKKVHSFRVRCAIAGVVDDRVVTTLQNTPWFDADCRTVGRPDDEREQQKGAFSGAIQTWTDKLGQKNSDCCVLCISRRTTTFGEARSQRTKATPATNNATGDQPSVPSLRLRRIPPIFPADKWNVHDTTVSGRDRTNNFSEGWNNGFRQLRRTQSSGSMAFDRIFPSGSVGHQTLAASPRTAACKARPSLHLAAAG